MCPPIGKKECIEGIRQSRIPCLFDGWIINIIFRFSGFPVGPSVLRQASNLRRKTISSIVNRGATDPYVMVVGDDHAGLARADQEIWNAPNHMICKFI
jgi:hypothetical protein